ncbi:MAG: hypothetical protein F7C35_07605 [Desulfurococcales archaeon]|nr:hypothetical protein [Desulfurococcales archaeon]
MGHRRKWRPYRVIAGAFAVWLSYELVMALLLRDVLYPADYIVIAFKAAYIASSLALTLETPRRAAPFIAYCSVPAGAAVRLSGAQIGYTWFPAMAATLGLAASLYGKDKILALINATAVTVFIAGVLEQGYFTSYKGPGPDGPIAAIIAALPLIKCLREDNINTHGIIWATLLAISIATRLLSQ